MARHVEILGTQQRTQLVLPYNGIEKSLGGARINKPVFPDIDRKRDGAGNILNGAGEYYDLYSIKYAGIRAVCLAPETDWDLLLVRFSREKTPRLLGPGQILFPLDGTTDELFVFPPMLCPSTRLYDATALRQRGSAPGSFPFAWVIAQPGSGDVPPYSFYNPTAGGLPWYLWTPAPSGTGGYWALQANTAAGASISHPPTILLNGAVGPAGGTNRASDASPDGVRSFAEYAEAGLIPWRDGASIAARPTAGLAFVSAAPTDSRGNAGDPTNPTTILFSAYSGKTFADPTSKWYGAAAVEVFVDECPPAGWRPRLPSTRTYAFDTIAVAANGVANQLPSAAFITVPGLNVRRAAFKMFNAGGQNIFAALGYPAPSDEVDAVASVLEQASVIGAGAGGDATGQDLAEPFIQIAIGSTNGGGGSTIRKGSMLTLVREHTGG